MRITVSQLRRIIKEEVSRSLREGITPDHEAVDEARSLLRIALRKYIGASGAQWMAVVKQIEGALDILNRAGLDAKQEAFELAKKLGFDDELLMELDKQVLDPWEDRTPYGG